MSILEIVMQLILSTSIEEVCEPTTDETTWECGLDETDDTDTRDLPKIPHIYCKLVPHLPLEIECCMYKYHTTSGKYEISRCLRAPYVPKN